MKQNKHAQEGTRAKADAATQQHVQGKPIWAWKRTKHTQPESPTHGQGSGTCKTHKAHAHNAYTEKAQAQTTQQRGSGAHKHGHKFARDEQRGST